MAGYLRRTLWSVEEKERRGLLRVLGDKQLKEIDRAGRECEAFLCHVRARQRAHMVMRAVRARRRANRLLRPPGIIRKSHLYPA